MVEILLLGLESDAYYNNNTISVLKAFKPEVITTEYSAENEELLNDEEKNGNLAPFGLFKEVIKIAPIKPITPTDKEYDDRNIQLTTYVEFPSYVFNEEGITFMEYYEGQRINELIMKGYKRIAVMVGGGHLPLTEVPVETPLIRTIMGSGEEIHFTLINQLREEDMNFARRINIEKRFKIRSDDLEIIRGMEGRTRDERLGNYLSIKGHYFDLANRLRILKKFYRGH